MPVSNLIANANFESGDTGWTKGTGWAIVENAGTQIDGTWLAQINTDDSGSQTSELLNVNTAAVGPDTEITLTGRVAGFGADGNVAAVFLDWLDNTFTRISKSQGNSSSNSSPGTWQTSTITATAPAGTKYVRAGVYGKAVANGTCKVDKLTWNWVNTLTVALVEPEEGDVITVGSTLRLEIELEGTGPTVESVSYTANGTEIANTEDSPYSYNVTDLAVGTYEIEAVVTLVGGETLTSAPVNITVQLAPIDPTTREFKASNAYTYLVGGNFSGLSAALPSTALVTGVEVLVDYTTKLLIRSKDKGIEAAGANSNVLFDITDGAVLEATLLTQDGSTYIRGVSPMEADVPLIRSDYDPVEEGTSEGMKWTVLENTTPISVTLGGEAELFGSTPITAAEFLDRSIGIRFLPNITAKPAYADNGDACIRLFIDKLRVRVYFDAGSAEYYFANPDKTEVIKGNLVSSYVSNGDLRTSDAEGVLQLQAELEVIDGAQTWIGDDWTIHANYPPTTDNQIGTVAAREADDGVGMAYNGLPSAAAVVANRSRYQFITANFFAVTALDSIYGAHGLPRAFAFNGTDFYKIYTQPEADKDQPRHLAYHHGHLALGFDDGRVDLSVIGQPYSYDGALGASEWSIGDRVTGLLPLSGTILGIFGSKSIWGLNGTTVDNFSTQVITPNIGAIEYTVTDMGYPVYANAYGVYTLAQTQQYGDYLGTPMSQDISPWLRPRLVRKYTSEKEVVVAWPVRSKNQYRLAFSDGYVMSMTLNAGQQQAPTFSFQQYTIYGPDDE